MSIGRNRGRRSSAVAPPLALALVAIVVAAIGAGTTQARSGLKMPTPTFAEAAAFDVSKPVREIAKHSAGARVNTASIRRDDGTIDRLPSVEPAAGGAASTTAPSAAAGPRRSAATAAAAIAAPLLTFEGLDNDDNLSTLAVRVNPPDPMGDVGPNTYVEMVNLVFAVFDKQGNKLLGPVPIGALWDGFAVPECADRLAGDPVVLYDQFADRWLLTQFSAPAGPTFYTCLAISQTGDPTGAYYRYAFTTGPNFPDYPKWGVWRDSYIITTREFGPTVEYGIGVYGLDRNKIIDGDPSARSVGFFLDGNAPGMLPLVGDGLLPPDIDGKTKPKNEDVAPIVGTQDDGGGYGATFDALNIWEFDVKWNAKAEASIKLAAQLPTASFDSIFPCGTVPGSLPPSSRDCLPQPGITDGSQYLDILSYRQRPTWRLAYRATKNYDTMVTNQSVEATPGMAGVRWYEIRRSGGVYSIHQQGTYAPADGVHRWMGSAAMDKNGNIALGYSVVNGTTVFPGIRYTGRLAGDPLGQMTLGEGVIINGSGVQTNTNSRWGDYTSMNVDPTDDCTFWYVNEYYQTTQPPPDRNWQTRIASLRLPGCS